MNKIKSALYRFMAGRYGNDALNNCLMAMVFILLLLNSFVFKNGIVYVVIWFVLILQIFRTYSRNIYKRRKENEAFLKLIRPFRKRVKLVQNQTKDKEHRYFICPQCSQSVRVPKGKGKIVITCPKCHNKFERKS